VNRQPPAESVGRIVSVRRATPSTRVLRIGLGDRAFPYEAGQAATISPPGADLRVPYSITSAPEDTQADGVVEFLIKADAAEKWGPSQPPFRRGMPLEVRGPYGTFTFPRDPGEQRFLFIAGGTGIAPLRSMIRHAAARGSGGSLHLLYSARARDEFAYLSDLRAMARRGEITLTLNVTREVPARWGGSLGRIVATQLAPLVSDTPTLCFVCGPEPMVADVAPMLRSLGVPPHRIRVEQW
jgi:NAD(P)H-flavin reductase